MFNTHHFENDLRSLNQKRRELEIAGFEFIRDAKDNPEGINAIEMEKVALIESGADVVILKTRGLLDIWAKKADIKR